MKKSNTKDLRLAHKEINEMQMGMDFNLKLNLMSPAKMNKLSKFLKKMI